MMKHITKFIVNGLWLAILVGFIYAFIQVNHIQNVVDAWGYTRVKSYELGSCITNSLNKQNLQCSLSLRVGKYAKTDEERQRIKEEYGIDISTDKDSFIDDIDWKDKLNAINQSNNKGGQEQQEIANKEQKGSTLSHLKSTQIPKEQIMNELNGLNVVDKYDFVKYDRKSWKHWDRLTPCWNVREEVLVNQANQYKLLDKDKQPTTSKENACYVESGIWSDIYSDTKLTKVSEVDIDHTVPILVAARSGGQNWDSKKKQTFANDLDNLVVTSSEINRSKGAKTPSEWLPPKEVSYCDYGKVYTHILHKYQLNITEKDKRILQDIVGSCDF